MYFQRMVKKDYINYLKGITRSIEDYPKEGNYFS